MSRSTQDKVMTAFETAATDYDLELVVDYNYNNRGIARFEDPTTFDDVALSFSFDFQLTNWRIENVTPPLPEFPAKDQGRSFEQTVAVYTEGNHVINGPTSGQVVQAVREHLARRKQELLKKEGLSA